jgi:uncharacterized membrane protein
VPDFLELLVPIYSPLHWRCTSCINNYMLQFHFSILSLLMLQMCLFIFTTLTGVIVYLSFFSAAPGLSG